MASSKEGFQDVVVTHGSGLAYGLYDALLMSVYETSMVKYWAANTLLSKSSSFSGLRLPGSSGSNHTVCV